LASSKLVSKNSCWLLLASFGTYFCMYGFRKPYTAASFSDLTYLGINYKVILVIAQTFGYLLSKWIGIKVVSEIKAAKRVPMLLILISFAEVSWLLFGLVPPPWNSVFAFLNGLPLGIVFGLILSFLEGRKNAEFLISGLCASFIVSDGFSKSVGASLLHWGVNEQWMPFLSGLLFVLPVLFFSYLLNRVQPPMEEDVQARSPRNPMTQKDRWYFFNKYAPGIVGIVLLYLFVTFLRSIRADFAPELWKGLGLKQSALIYTTSELWVSLAVLIVSGLTIYFRNHAKAFLFSLFMCIVGFVLCLAAAVGLHNGLAPFFLMVLLGLGVYLPYVGIHTTIFERWIAATRENANIGFLMYIADSIGYTGYAVLLLFKSLYSANESILDAFLILCFTLGILGVMVATASFSYFYYLFKRLNAYEA
jgi:hypothetical protein